MNYEKKYNEALKWMRELYPWLHGATREDAEHYFPELRESNDERIRECICMALTDVDEQRFKDFGTTLKDCLSWLEKQKEQKPAEWSEEDEVLRQDCIRFIETGWTDNGKSHLIPWLKSLPERFNLQPKQEWSEKDQDKINTILGILHLIGNYNFDSWLKSIRPQPKQEWNEYDNEMFHCISDNLCHLRKLYEHNVDHVSDYNKMIEWFRNRFKSLRPSWKPSEEQMSMLLAVINEPNNSGAESCQIALRGIYEQLKKL